MLVIMMVIIQVFIKLETVLFIFFFKSSLMRDQDIHDLICKSHYYDMINR